MDHNMILFCVIYNPIPLVCFLIVSSTYVEPIHIYHVSHTPHTPISSLPFKSTGYHNSTWKKLFSHPTYEYAGPLSIDLSNHERGVNKEGAPVAVHTGVTSMRAKTYGTGIVGSGVPYANRKLDLNKVRRINNTEERADIFHHSNQISSFSFLPL